MPARMLLSRWIVAVGSILLAHQSPAQKKWKFDAYPDYLEVLERLYANYEVGCTDCTVKLVKDPEGWSATYLKDDKVIEKHALWSYAKRKYLKPDLQELGKGEARSEQERAATTAWTAGYYRVSPYYGYRGWYTDVINEYGAESDPPLRLMYALARAHSAASRCPLGDFVDECPEGAAFIDTTLSDRLTPTELTEYDRLAEAAIEAYRKLAAIDPDYETHIGEASLKSAHEPVTMYMDLLTVGEPEVVARRMLRPGQYDAFYIAMAKNYLVSCDSNAILFTNGDSDSYPLWYVQATEGFRTDVLVLNASLMNLPRYLDVMRNGHLGSAPLNLDLSSSEYADDGTMVVFSNEDAKDTVDAPRFLEHMHIRLKAHTAYNMRMPYGYMRVPFTNDKTVSWKLPRHMFRSALAMLDMIANHVGDRSLHWAVTVGPDNFVGLDEHLVNQGLVSTLSAPGTGTALNSGGGKERVSAQRAASLFLNEFDWSGLDHVATNRMRMMKTYALQMSKTAEALLVEGDTLRAKEVLDACVRHFPDSIWKFDRIMLPTIEAYYAMGAYEEGDHIAIALLINLKTVPDHVGPTDDPNPDDNRIRGLVIQRVGQRAEEHHRQVVLDAIKALTEGWPEPVIGKW